MKNLGVRRKNYGRGIFYLLIFLSVIAGAAVLKILASVILPVVFAVTLVLAIYPLVKKLNCALHIPWNIASTAIVALVFIVVYQMGSFFIISLNSLARQIPDFMKRFTTIYSALAERLHIPFDDGISLFDNILNQIGGVSTIQRLVVAFTSKLMGYSKNLILVVFLILFLMSEVSRFQEKVEAAFKGKVKGRVTHAIKNIVDQVARYLSLKFIISLMTGVYVTIGMTIVGLDYPVIWGVFAFVLNFIPYFGSAISIIATTLYSLLQFYPNLQLFVITGIIVGSANIIMGNIIEPNLMGSNLGLSPFIILTSMSIWAWMWGFSGMLLAVPATVIMKIVCENISYLHPIAIFLGSSIEKTTKEFSPVDSDEDEATSETEPSLEL